MDMILVFTLSLCWWAAAARSTWSDKPHLLVSSSEIQDGQTVLVTCTVPIDYRGGDCRLFRENSQTPFRLMTATGYICVFQLTSNELLGRHPVGSRVFFTCDYKLQQYTSQSSDIKGVTVWGSSPRPHLYVSHRFVSPEDSVEVTCSPPSRSVSRCLFFRGEVRVSDGSCRRNLTGQQLAIWTKSTVLLPVNMTCSYDPDRWLSVRSEPSNHSMLYVVDTRQASSSVDCTVSVEDSHMVDSSWSFVGADGQTVTVQVTNSSLTPEHTCNHRAQ